MTAEWKGEKYVVVFSSHAKVEIGEKLTRKSVNTILYLVIALAQYIDLEN